MFRFLQLVCSLWLFLSFFLSFIHFIRRTFSMPLPLLLCAEPTHVQTRGEPLFTQNANRQLQLLGPIVRHALHIYHNLTSKMCTRMHVFKCECWPLEKVLATLQMFAALKSGDRLVSVTKTPHHLLDDAF